MMAEIIYYLVAFLFHSALLMAVLWIMIKLQGFNYTFLGLLGTAAAGGALDMIPYVGHTFAVVTLYICITKMTRASMFPDAAFTVAVGYALMFAAKVLAFTWLIGNLHYFPAAAGDTPTDEPQALEAADNPTTSTNPAPATVKSNPAKAKAADEFIHELAIKGVTQNGERSSVTVNYRQKNYVIFTGETVLLPRDEKTVPLKLEKVDGHSLIFSLEGEAATRTY